MTGYKLVNLQVFIETVGEDAAKRLFSDFSCPLNKDVEYFLKAKSISFARQGWAQTHLVFASYQDKPVLVGYFTLSNKYIRIPAKIFGGKSSTLRRRITKFATYDPAMKEYSFAAPLIAQLGKNYANGYNKLITGDELLEEACNKIRQVQFEMGGRFAFLECEDKERLISFYSDNGFCEFDKRKLDADETDKMSGEYLVQMLKYIHKK